MKSTWTGESNLLLAFSAPYRLRCCGCTVPPTDQLLRLWGSGLGLWGPSYGSPLWTMQDFWEHVMTIDLKCLGLFKTEAKRYGLFTHSPFRLCIDLNNYRFLKRKLYSKYKNIIGAFGKYSRTNRSMKTVFPDQSLGCGISFPQQKILKLKQEWEKTDSSTLPLWNDNFMAYGLTNSMTVTDHALWTEAVATWNGVLTWIDSYLLNSWFMQQGYPGDWMSRNITIFWF